MVQDLLEMISDAPVDHAGQWRPVRVRRGIHIWTSTVEGSPYCRIRGRMRCEATPAQLLALLIDDERWVRFAPKGTRNAPVKQDCMEVGHRDRGGGVVAIAVLVYSVRDS